MQIYQTPDTIKKPNYDFTNFSNWKDEEKSYLEATRIWCQDHQIQEGLPASDHIGEVIDFPVADGCASYMVISLEPLELFHLFTSPRRIYAFRGFTLGPSSWFRWG